MALRWQWRFAGSGVGWMRRQELSPGAAAPSHALPALRTRGIWSWGKWKDLHGVPFLLGFVPCTSLSLRALVLRRLSQVPGREFAGEGQGCRLHRSKYWPWCQVLEQLSWAHWERPKSLIIWSEPPEKELGLRLWRCFSSRKNLFLHGGEYALSTCFFLDGFSRFLSGSV